jgi:hypothetical protein
MVIFTSTSLGFQIKPHERTNFNSYFAPDLGAQSNRFGHRFPSGQRLSGWLFTRHDGNFYNTSIHILRPILVILVTVSVWILVTVFRLDWVIITKVICFEYS